MSLPIKSRAESKTYYEVSNLGGYAPSASGMRANQSEDRQVVRVTASKGLDMSITCTCCPSAEENHPALYYPCKHTIAVLIRMGKLSSIYDHPERFYHRVFLVEPFVKVLQETAVDTAFDLLPTMGNTFLGPLPLPVSKSALGRRIPSRSAIHLGEAEKAQKVNRIRRCSVCRSELHDVRKCKVKHIAIEDRAQFLADQEQASAVEEGNLPISSQSMVCSLPIKSPTEVSGHKRSYSTARSTDEEEDFAHEEEDEDKSEESPSAHEQSSSSDSTSYLFNLVRSIFSSK